MNLALSDELRLLQSSLARLFAEHSTGVRIRASEPLGFDRELWQTVVAMDLPMLRAPQEYGGSDASLMHALIAAEEAGTALASIPLVEAIVTNRLVAQLAAIQPNTFESLLDDCAQGHSIATIALYDISEQSTQLVPGAAIAKHVLCLDGTGIELRSGIQVHPPTPSHGSVPATIVDLKRVKCDLKLESAKAVEAFRMALEEWKLLMAALVAMAGRRSVERAAEYACEREAFGRPIGEYQGVSHPLANAITDLDVARLLAWRAADALARNEPEAAALVSAAFWAATSRAGPAALTAMRVFGGYGMTMEYDAQLYFRRINAWSLAAGDPELLLEQVAARLWDDAEIPLPDAGDPEISFDWSTKALEAAARMEDFVERHDTQNLQRFMRESLDCFDPELYRELAGEGLLYPDSPTEYGGSGLSGEAAAAVRDVANSHYWNLLVPSVTDMVWKIVHRFGSDEARSEILPKIFAGEAYCTLAYSEPSGGSDIFAAKTTAVREGDEWRIDGQKMFTSTGHIADYALMIARTAPDKYRGLTMFIVPIHQPGYEVSEIKTIGDERTNITFYNNVRVADRYRLGEVNGGVKVMAIALTIEQAVGDLYVMSLKHLLREALAWARRPSDLHHGKPPYQSADVRRALAETAVKLAAEDALNRRCVWQIASGKLGRSEGPMAKLYGSEAWVACAARLQRIATPESLFKTPDAVGAIEWMLRRSISGTIFAGTSEIQRSLIAETALGLPRSR